MTDADSSELRVIRIDGDFRRSLPEDVRWAATLLMAYLDGLTDGQRGSHASSPGPGDQRPPATPPASRAELEGQAEAALAAENQNPAALLAPANVCGPISGAPTPTTPISAPVGSSSDREVVVVWGSGAYETARRVLP
jgi:hypothetical protein